MSQRNVIGDNLPVYAVPPQRLVSIEHPCIVRNLDNGFRSLGGEQQLKDVLDHEVGETQGGRKVGKEPVAGVSLRPNDPFAKKLSSTGVQTQNLLIRVSVPKRTGRKRKRGSTEPYVELSTVENSADMTAATDLVRRMRDNPDRYTIEPVGVIADTHRFSTLPDFQTRAAEVPIMREIRDRVMIPDYERLKAFSTINIDPQLNGVSSFPGPPSFLYSYHTRRRPEPERNAYLDREEAVIKLMSGPNPPSQRELSVPVDAAEFPKAPPAKLPKAAEGPVRRAIEALKTLLDERPIITRRVYLAKLPSHREKDIKWAVPYVGFWLTSGPWRHVIVKYGVDPRKDPQYRFYQTLSYSNKALDSVKRRFGFRAQSDSKLVFDGKTVNLKDAGGVWQLCDLQDATLRALVNTDDIRTRCDSGAWGWYKNGTLAKLCVIMRDQMLRIARQETAVAAEKYGILVDLPNEVAVASQCYLDATRYGRYLSHMAEAIGDEAVTGTVTKLRGYEVMVSVETREMGDFGEGGEGNGARRVREHVVDQADAGEETVNPMPEALNDEIGADK